MFPILVIQVWFPVFPSSCYYSGQVPSVPNSISIQQQLFLPLRSVVLYQKLLSKNYRPLRYFIKGAIFWSQESALVSIKCFFFDFLLIGFFLFLGEMFLVLIFPRRQRCGAGVESTMKFITPSYIRRLADESTQYPALLAVSTTRPISSYFMKVCKNRS